MSNVVKTFMIFRSRNLLSKAKAATERGTLELFYTFSRLKKIFPWLSQKAEKLAFS